MPDLETIRRLTIQAKTEGVDQAKDQLNQLADAQKKVGEASGVTANVTDTAARSQLSAAQAYHRLRSQIDENYRAQQKIAGGQAVLDRALRQGAIGAEEHARALDLLNKRYAVADPASQKVTMSLGEQRRAIKTLVAEMSLAGGPLGDLVSKSGLLYFGSMRLSPAMVATAISIAAVTAAIYKSVEAYIALEQHQQKVANALALTRGASGQTAGSLEQIARRLVLTGPQTLDEIRGIELELLRFKTVSGDVFQNVLALSQKVAATGFADMRSAARALAESLKDPTRASETLKDVSLGLSVAEQRLATDLFNTGKVSQAQQVVLNAVATQLGNVRTRGDTVSDAWDRVTKTTGNTLERWGEAIAKGTNLAGILNSIADALDRAARPRSFEEQIAELDRLAAAAQNPSRQLRFRLAQTGRTTEDYQATIENRRRDLLYSRGVELLKQSLAEKKAAEDASAAADAAAKKRIDEVTDALKVQARTAGMTALQQEAYNERLKAGVEANSEAGRAITAYVNQVAALRFMRQTTDQIEAQTGSLKIEAATFGMTAGAAAAYRMEQEALLRAQIQGISLSDAQKQRIHDLAQAYGEAAQRVETLRNAQAAASALSSAMADGLFDVVTRAKTASQAILDLSNSILKMVMQAALAGQGPLAGLFGTNVSGGLFGSLFKNLFTATLFHDGGMVAEAPSSRLGRAMQSSIVVPASIIPTLPRYHSGLASDERLAVLQTGEEVRSRAQVQADRRKKQANRDERPISVYAPMTVIAPDPPKFNNSRGQLARTVGTAWKQAHRFM
jgi:hypothetical protein